MLTTAQQFAIPSFQHPCQDKALEEEIFAPLSNVTHPHLKNVSSSLTIHTLPYRRLDEFYASMHKGYGEILVSDRDSKEGVEYPWKGSVMRRGWAWKDYRGRMLIKEYMLKW